MIFFATIHGGSTLFIWGVSHHIQEEVILVLFIDDFCIHPQKWINFLYILELALVVDGSFSIICMMTDTEMAEDWQDIPCWGDCSSYRISYLDHSTSSNTEKKV